MHLLPSLYFLFFYSTKLNKICISMGEVCQDQCPCIQPWDESPKWEWYWFVSCHPWPSWYNSENIFGYHQELDSQGFGTVIVVGRAKWRFSWRGKQGRTGDWLPWSTQGMGRIEVVLKYSKLIQQLEQRKKDPNLNLEVRVVEPGQSLLARYLTVDGARNRTRLVLYRRMFRRVREIWMWTWV